MKSVAGSGKVTITLGQGEREIVVTMSPEDAQQLRSTIRHAKDGLSPEDYAEQVMKGNLRPGAQVANAVTDLLRDI